MLARVSPSLPVRASLAIYLQREFTLALSAFTFNLTARTRVNKMRNTKLLRTRALIAANYPRVAAVACATSENLFTHQVQMQVVGS